MDSQTNKNLNDVGERLEGNLFPFNNEFDFNRFYSETFGKNYRFSSDVCIKKSSMLPMDMWFSITCCHSGPICLKDGRKMVTTTSYLGFMGPVVYRLDVTMTDDCQLRVPAEGVYMTVGKDFKQDLRDVNVLSGLFSFPEADGFEIFDPLTNSVVVR